MEDTRSEFHDAEGSPQMSSLLLVEDSLTQATQIRLTLKKAGFDVYVAENGRLALDVLQTHEPDLVLTDLQMPEMDGLQLVDAVRRDHPHLPVVLMTSHGSDDKSHPGRYQSQAHRPRRPLSLR